MRTQELLQKFPYFQGRASSDESTFMEAIATLRDKVAKKHLDEKEEQFFVKAFSKEISEEPMGDDVLTTLSLLMNSLRKKRSGRDFKSQIVDVVMRGGDGICAQASVIGGVLGALLGYSNLPQDWLKQLPVENIILLNGKLNLLLDLFGLP